MRKVLSERTTYRECDACGREMEARESKRLKIDGGVVWVCKDSNGCLFALDDRTEAQVH